MTKRLLSKKEQELLKLYVKAVSEKAITYTDEFKRYFAAENVKGKFPREIFEEAGFPVDLIGMKRWRTAYRKTGMAGLHDTRGTNSGRSLDRN